MKAVTAGEMRLIDQTAITEFGIPGVVLMENAGRELARQIALRISPVGDKSICIFAGKGNNGGDGFVAARHLANQGAQVKVCLVGAKEALAGDALVHFETIQRMGLDILELASERDWDKAGIAVTFADCLVDALLGTGFQGQLSEAMNLAVDLINAAGKPVVAVNIPTGMDADTGQISSKAVKAAYTVTFGLPKQGLYIHPGAAYAGQISVIDIGIPRHLLENPEIRQNITTPGHIQRILPVRPVTAHKGDCGRVLLIAGSQGMTGAAALAATGAIRTGAGLVTLGIAASLHDIMEVKLTEVMTRPLPETVGGSIGVKSIPYVEQMVKQTDVLAIGPGLGRHEDTLTAVREIVKSSEQPLVLDADALFAMVDHTDLLKQTAGLAVLTPHPGEMARLTGLSVAEVNQERIFIARQAASDWQSIVVLKGPCTVVAFPDGEIFLNTTGNPGLATGGAGDVLTGIIAGFIAQGLSSHDAAVAGVYIHGLAGDLAARGRMIGMTAGDVLPEIPYAIHLASQRKGRHGARISHGKIRYTE